MIKQFLLTAIAFYLAGCCTAPKPTPNVPAANHAPPAANPVSANLSILEHPGINQLKATLALVLKNDAPSAKTPQHFFVAKYIAGANRTFMYWVEGRKLWIMPLSSNIEEGWAQVTNPSGGQLIDVDEDVVATNEEIGSSTYLVSQPWVAQRIYDTVVKGDLITLDPSK
jgi:hypothetical protein